MSLERDQVGRLAAIQPVRHPGGLFALEAAPVEQVHRPVELVEHPAESLQLVGQGGSERQRLERGPPVLVGEQTTGRQRGAHPTRHVGGGHGRGRGQTPS
jgi:hypothetical protein